MSIFCNSCPNKSAIKIDFAIQCKNCLCYYHKSCAGRTGYVKEGVLNKCCGKLFKNSENAENKIKNTTPITIFNSNINSDTCDSLDICDNLVLSPTFIDSSELVIHSNQKSDSSTMEEVKEQLKSLFSNFEDKFEKKFEEKFKSSFDVGFNMISDKLNENITKIIDDKIQSHINELNNTIADLYNKIDILESKVDKIKNDNIDTSVFELDERNKRKKSILLVNVPDVNNEVKDVQLVQNLFTAVKDKIDIVNINVFRLGKFSDAQVSPRLLKVTFVHKKHAQWLLFNYKKLNLEGNITCKPDRTLLQRSNLKNVLIELKNREQKGESNLTIKYKNGVPEVVSKLNFQNPNGTKKKT